MKRRQRRKNPAELVLMGANPLRMVNSHFSEDEKLALGRLGISWKGIQTQRDVTKARRALKDAAAIRRRFKNPAALGEDREVAQQIYSGFHATDSQKSLYLEEPHIPAGTYPELGLLVSIKFKPASQAQQTFISEKENIHVVSDLDRKHIYFAGGDQTLAHDELRSLGWNGSDKLVVLGTAREIAYIARKFHEAVPENGRGEIVEWVHQFGEETGQQPEFCYDTQLRRISLRGGEYRIENEGIVN